MLPSDAVRSLEVHLVVEQKERDRREREREREEEEEEEEEEAVGGSRFLSMNIATFLKVEVAGSSETPVSAHKTTTHHVLQYHSINNDPLQRLSR